MAERKVVNKYYPPDWDPSMGSINKYVGQHPLRDRARKLDQGILIIRFELPYNIWCGGCGKMIGMGTRFNAEKKKVGNYYSTPIYSFSMKCAECPNRFTIETDPKNCDYKVTSGAARKQESWDPDVAEGGSLPDKAEQMKMTADAMYRLEHGVGDEMKAKQQLPVLHRLQDLQSRMKNDYDLNSDLRKTFRTEKKEIKKQKAVDDQLLKRSSLSIKLLPERAEDIRHASLVKFGSQSIPDQVQDRAEAIKRKSIFAPKPPTPTSKTGTSSANSGTLSTATTSATTSSAKRKPVDPEMLKKEKALRHGRYLAITQHSHLKNTSAPSTPESSGRLIKSKSANTKNSNDNDIDDNVNDDSEEQYRSAPLRSTQGMEGQNRDKPSYDTPAAPRSLSHLEKDADEDDRRSDIGSNSDRSSHDRLDGRERSSPTPRRSPTTMHASSAMSPASKRPLIDYGSDDDDFYDGNAE